MLRGSRNIIAASLFVITASGAAVMVRQGVALSTWIPITVVGLVLAASPRQITEWERAVLLRLGKFRRILDPGIVWVVPGVDVLAKLVDMRIRATPFSAEKTLTKDTVPVNVDAVLFWIVTDAKRAVLEVQEYMETISWAAQTTLRDVIGRTELVRMISDREALDSELQATIDAKTSEWGITVQSVEIRDVRIPSSLEDAMSRKAQADREKEARIILAESESAVADEMHKAASVYQADAVAMRLRAMNMTYESIKERGALMVVPSDMANSLDGTLGAAAASFRMENQPVASEA